MLPNAYEFDGDPYRLVFVGFFLTVITVIVVYLAWSALRAWIDVSRGNAPALRWHDDFEALPEARRHCRHTLGGDRPARLCEHGFECADCEHFEGVSTAGCDRTQRVHGLEVEPDLRYHRGHTWVRPGEDGRVTVGLSPLALRMLPAGAVVRLPEIGSVLRRGEGAFAHDADALRVLTPIAGRVVGHRTEDGAPVLDVDPFEAVDDRVDLLRGDEAAAWLESELHALQSRVLGPEAARTLADGGSVSADLTAAVPDADWTELRREIFLDV